MVPIKRLFAHAVAGDEQATARRVPKGKGKHAVEPEQQRVAPLLVGMDKHLGVAVGSETVPVALQGGADGAVVVDFTIKNHCEAAIFVEDRLIAAAQVNNREAAHRHAHGAAQKDAVAIRPPVGEAVVHTAQQIRVNGLPVLMHHAADTTHWGQPSFA